MNERRTVELDEGWNHMAVSSLFDCAGSSLNSSPFDFDIWMQSGIGKLKRLLEGEDETSFNAEQYMMLYTYVRRRMIPIKHMPLTLTHCCISAGRYTTCAPRSLHMITQSSCITDTVTASVSTLLRRYKPHVGPNFSAWLGTSRLY